MSSISQFYAKALVDVDQKSSKELMDLKKAFTKEEIEFFNSSLVAFEVKKKIIEALPLSGHISRFLIQITLKRRWSYFFDICEHYFQLVDERENVLKGWVYSTQTLPEQMNQKILESVGRFFPNKKIILKNRIQKDLVNGIKVQIGGYSFNNASVYHLDKFKQEVLKKIN